MVLFKEETLCKLWITVKKFLCETTMWVYNKLSPTLQALDSNAPLTCLWSAVNVSLEQQ